MDLPSGLRYESNGIIYMNFRLLGKKINQSTRTTDPVEAEAILYKTREDMLKASSIFAEEPKQTDLTLGQALDITFEEVHAKQKQGANLRSTKEVCKSLIGATPLTQVRRKTFHELKTKLLERGCSLSTVNHYYALVNATLGHMEKVHEAPCSPVARVKEKAPKAEKVVFTESIEEKLWQYLSNDKWFKKTKWTSQDATEVFKVALLTGMRRSEVISFTPEMYRDGVVYFGADQHKSGGTKGIKAIPVSTEVKEIIEGRIARLSIPKGRAVFDGITKDMLTRLPPRFRLAMGIRDEVTFHSLRHTFITRMLASGAPIKQVSMLVGHSTVTTTEVYSHLTTEDLRKTVDKYVIRRPKSD